MDLKCLLIYKSKCWPSASPTPEKTNFFLYFLWNLSIILHHFHKHRFLLFSSLSSSQLIEISGIIISIKTISGNRINQNRIKRIIFKFLNCFYIIVWTEFGVRCTNNTLPLNLGDFKLGIFTVTSCLIY